MLFVMSKGINQRFLVIKKAILITGRGGEMVDARDLKSLIRKMDVWVRFPPPAPLARIDGIGRHQRSTEMLA